MNNIPSSIPGLPSNQKYFEERKKGEMIQLKNLLNTVINDNDLKKGLETVRKVIGYMTLGMDASIIFPQMCRASYLNDQIIKKMIYFYLTSYAEDNADLAIMAINTFKKDCKHSSPKIRGLALRHLCSFKSSDYVNTVLPMVRELLTDFEPYVKKTAIMGLVKVFYHDPGAIYNDSELIDTLSSLIRDSDALVSLNAIRALDQVLVSQGGIPLNTRLFFYILNRLKEYNQWQQATLLEILSRYQPETEKQSFQIMSVLWQKLKHSSTPLVLSSIRIIISLAKKKESELYSSVVEKIKAPLLTLMSGNDNTGTFQTNFIVLEHIKYVIKHMNGKKFYEKDFKHFYCKIDEPTYIKEIKVNILGLLANESNLGDLLNELNDYATQVDIHLARKSLRTLADIAVRLPEVNRALLANLISFYKIEKEHLANEIMVCFEKILRKYPKLFSEVQPVLLEYRGLVKETESLQAFIWILGTFANSITQAPYILEQYLEKQSEFLSYHSGLKEVLLTQAVQMFLKRPPQSIKMLGTIFSYILTNESNPMSLVDHAAFYYRALKDDPQEVGKVFRSFESEMSKYSQKQSEVVGQNIFNTLGIIYKQSESKFIRNYEYFVSIRSKELGLIPDPDSAPESQEHNEPEEDHGQISEPPALEAHDLVEGVILSSEEFEEYWEKLQGNAVMERRLLNEEYLDEESTEELFRVWRIYSMASVEEDQVVKLYLYCCHSTSFACMELQINKLQKILLLTTKAPTLELSERINQYVEMLLQLNQFI